MFTRATPGPDTEAAAKAPAAPAAQPGRQLTPANVIALQRSAGNAAVSRAILARQPDGDGDGGAGVAQLQGPENHLGEKIEITGDLLGLLGDGKDTSEGPGTVPKTDLSLIPGDDKQRVADTDYSGGKAFVKGAGDTDEVDANDVRQGKLGDCYLCAAMMAVARQNPARIKQLISKREDGNYDVTLYLKAYRWVGKLEPTIITVSPTFPTLDGKSIYAKEGDQAKDGPELWAMLIEKAFAKYKGSYKDIADGNAGDAAAMLTGGEDAYRKTEDFIPLKIAQLIDYALRDKKAVTASTRAMAEDESAAVKQERADAGVVAHHAYAVVGVDVENETLDLLNPWGRKDLNKISIETVFKKWFSSWDTVTT